MIERKLGDNILNALQALPVVYVNGPRQAGKSTLVQKLAERQWPAEYITFDEATLLGAASTNPESFLRSFQHPVILDEVQMVPELFRVLKLLVDEVRINDKAGANGHFLLTGSANIMALPQLSDALVGRMSVLTLFPLSAVEVNNGKGNFISQLLQNNFRPGKIKRKFRLSDIIRRATFPEITDLVDAIRQQWFEGYMTTILQRDVRQIADIAKLAVLPNLLRILAGRTGGLINEADISRAIGQNAVTAKSYRVLLQMMFLTFDVKPWYRNISKRLVKSPKGYIVDTALLCHLQQINLKKIEINDPHVFGHVFENFVASELIKQLSWLINAPSLFHFRTSDGKEVDFILETHDGALVAIEVKGRDSVNAEDFRGLKILQNQIKEDFICGIVIYRGDKVVPFDNNLWAVPVDLMWA
ncbi:MAG: ATP-binding protein [Gammaproteobacteria bacterium]|nr:ATP-binding protein [Gammaproteobacteria bacterium]